MRFHNFFGDDALLLTDPKSLNHILLSRSYDFPKPKTVQEALCKVLGSGLLLAEGEAHRRQKKVMLPAFSPSALKSLTPIFYHLSYKLRDIWLDLAENSTTDQTAFKDDEAFEAYEASSELKSPGAVIEVSRWLNRLILDIIGLTGFGYAFSSLDQKSTVLGEAFSTVLSRGDASLPSTAQIAVAVCVGTLISYFPILMKLPIKDLQ